MGLYLVDSAPPFVWPKVDGFPRSCSGVSPGAEDRSSGRSRRRRCCGGSPAGSAGLYASTPLLVPESEGLPSGPHGHWLHGWPGSPSSLLSWLCWGSTWFSSVSLPPQSGGVWLALVVFISRSGGGLFSGLTVTSLSPSCTKKLWAAKGSSLHRSLSSPSASGFCFQAVFSSTVWLPFASQADGPSHLLGSPFSLGFSCESLGP